jgi:penicillin-insensitive murein DD-endopeptidase
MMKLLLIILLIFSANAFSEQSTCFGTTANGRLENGQQLPSNGPNFESYSFLAETAGRTFVHSAVASIIVYSYKALEASQSGKVFKYAETGFKEGGKFWPHKTHQNGLSVDFMTPVKNADGVSVHLPTSPLNKFGYNIEFNKAGVYEDLSIDYEAMAAHIVALHKAAKSQGYDLWRVIFDPQLQVGLFNTQYSDYLKANIQFSKKRSWVRHDEHYHVDFLIPCERL